MSELKLAVFTDFNDCELEISKFIGQIGNNNPFLKIDWLKLWWDHFSEENSLYLILFYDNDRIVGFAPFFVKYHSFYRLHKFNLIGDGFSSYLDIIFDSKYNIDILNTLFDHFRSNFRNVIVNFNDINNKFSQIFSPLNKAMGSVSHGSSFQIYPCPLTILGEDWEIFFKTRGDYRSRYNLRKRFERLSSMFGEFTFREVHDVNEIPFLMGKLEEIHQGRFVQTYNQLFKGISRNFIYNLLCNLSKYDVSLSIIEIDKVPISFLIGFNMGEVFIDFAPAFDPAFASFAPGNIHLLKLMKLKADQGIKYFDFSKGEAEYKRWWSNDESSSYLFRFGFNLNLLGLLYFKYKELLNNLLLYMREKGYNKKIKYYIAMLVNYKFTRPKDNNISLVDNEYCNASREELQFNKWSYATIQDYPINVREYILKLVAKIKMAELYIAEEKAKGLIILETKNGNQRYVVKY